MTDAQKRLRELLARQSQERGRMAELAAVDELTDETRSELDALEKGTPDLERQLRAVRDWWLMPMGRAMCARWGPTMTPRRARCGSFAAAFVWGAICRRLVETARGQWG